MLTLLNMNLLTFLIDEHALNSLFADFSLLLLIFVIAVTIILLTRGADWMIEGSVNLAKKTGMSKVIIGATILSLGTTAPEVFVSVMAAFMGDSGLALGNGIGSIIADTGLIFGITVLIAAPPVNKWILNRTGWWQLGSAVFVVLLAAVSWILFPDNPVIFRWMGVILVVLLAVYLYMTYYWAKNGNASPMPENIPENDEDIILWKTFLMLFGGLSLVIISSRLLIPAAGETAKRLGVPADVIAATMVAFGTSLPELMTAITAVRKGHPEITVGNIVGADVLNALFVIGAASIATPLSIPKTFYIFHFPVMLIILLSFRVFISASKSGKFRRWQGGWLLFLYICYIVLQYTKTSI
jgi:cation:H+ antiporter